MIIRTVRGNIFTSGLGHIAFGVNAEGHNHEGFAGMVSRTYWHALGHTGQKNLGETLSHQSGDRTFHALVCHYARPGGFSQTPTVITQCLDALSIPVGEDLACVMVGGGPLGQALGADTGAILEGIKRSQKRVVVYSL